MLLISLFLSIPYVTFLSLRLTVIVSSAVANSIVGVVDAISRDWGVEVKGAAHPPAVGALGAALLAYEKINSVG